MGLTRYEQEVVINLNAEERLASVYTAHPVWIRKINRLKEENPEDVIVIREEEDAIEVKVPKSWIRISPKRVMSEEQKNAARERFAALRKEHPEKFLPKKN